MATMASILSVMVEANTGNATSRLAQFDRQLEATRMKARSAVEAKLGGNFDKAAFGAYESKLIQTQRRVADKAAFKAALGGNFNNAAFNAYERQLTRTEKNTTSSHTRIISSFGRMASAIGAAGLAYTGFNAAKNAVEQVGELTYATTRLMAATGMDAKTASSWIEVMKVRGVQANALSMGFITLERNLRNAANGSKASELAFKQLGVSAGELKNMGLQDVILQLADAYQHDANAKERAAIAQQLFGRNAKILMPVLAAGRQGVEDLLGAAQRYGAYIDNNQIGTFKRAHEAQLALNLAMDGLKITFVQSVLPALVTVASALMTFIGQIRTGTGAGGEFARIVSAAFDVVKTAVQVWLAVTKVAIGIVTAVIQACEAAFGALSRAAQATAGAVSSAFGAVKGAVRSGVGVVVAVVDTGKAAFGALGKAAGAVASAVSNAFVGVKNAVRSGIAGALGIINGAFNAFYNAGKFIINAVGSGFRAAINAVLGIIVSFINAIIGVIDVIPGVHIGKLKAPKFAEGGKYATGGKVMAPGYFAGEEAPRHPEFILATNPAYRQRNLGLFAQAGKALGVPGFAGGGIAGGANIGIYGMGQLESLWDAAGGSPARAQLMAAIALAESGGNPRARNSSGASGLWQIMMPSNEGYLHGGSVWDPLTNARAAVGILASQGLGAWTTYTSGAYRQYMGGGGGIVGAVGSVLGAIGGVLAGGVDAILGQLPKPPKLPDWISGLPGWLLGKAKDAIGSLFSGAINAVSGPGSTGGPTGIGTFQGIPVANWVIGALEHAISKGVNVRITSGYRGGRDPHTATGASEHAGAQYPHGAVDFGGYHDAAAYAMKMAVVAATADYKWPLLAPIGFVDDGHASGTGHFKGGIYKGAFGAGGIVTAAGPTLALFGERGPETAVFVPHYATGGIDSGGSFLSAMGMPGLPKLPPAPRTVAGARGIAGTIQGLTTRISAAQHKYSVLDSYFGLSTETYLTPDGQVDQGAINRRLAELLQLGGAAQEIFDLFQRIVAWTQRLVEANENIVADAKTRLASALDLLRRWRKALAGIHLKGLKGGALASAKQHQKNLKASIDYWQKIEGQARADIATYAGNAASARGDLMTRMDERDSAWLDILRLQGEATTVSGTTATAASTAAGAAPAIDTTAAAAAATPDTTSQQLALTQQLLTQSQQTLAVSQAQYKVLSNTPPFGGSFAEGGIVPGPIGAPRVIVAHGGEAVGAPAGDIRIIAHFPPGTDWLRDKIRFEVQQGLRPGARLAQRRLPGSGGI